MRLFLAFVAIIASLISCDLSVYAANEEPAAAPSSSQESPPPLPVVDLGDRKAETVAGTGSPDGRLALAWTLRPSKDAEPVDWNLLGKDRDKFKDTYGNDEKYFVELLLVDHKSNKNLGRNAAGQYFCRAGQCRTPPQVLEAIRKRPACLPYLAAYVGAATNDMAHPLRYLQRYLSDQLQFKIPVRPSAEPVAAN